VQQACEVLGLPRASVYRANRPVVYGPAPAPTGGCQPNALSPDERHMILALLNSDRFLDKAPEQVWAVTLDEGSYLGSVSTFYRILRENGQVRERRSQAVHPTRVCPELIADGPNQVWSWDITKLKGPTRGVYFDAYVILDIFSRKVIHWEVHVTENGDLAKNFIDRAIAVNDGVMPDTIHSDNGTSMTSRKVADLLADLYIQRSLSRPHVSNDNPYSEAAFKTVKYCPAFPDNFTSLYDARVFMGSFMTYYNIEHRHSGIGLYTPSSVHDGTWKQVRHARQIVLDAAYATHPDRFRGGHPVAPELPGKVWINRPPSKIETQQDLNTAATR
jgi:putative transposase